MSSEIPNLLFCHVCLIAAHIFFMLHCHFCFSSVSFWPCVVSVWEHACRKHLQWSDLPHVLPGAHQDPDAVQTIPHRQRSVHVSVVCPSCALSTHLWSAPLGQESSVPMWRNNSCGTVSSWGCTPPWPSSTLCSSSSASTSTSPPWSSTSSSPSPSSRHASDLRRMDEKPPFSASNSPRPQTRTSQVSAQAFPVPYKVDFYPPLKLFEVFLFVFRGRCCSSKEAQVEWLWRFPRDWGELSDPFPMSR